MSSIKSLLDSHLSEINRLSTIKTNEVDFKKLIKYTISIHSKAYKNFNSSKSENSLVKASKQSIKAWEHSRYINGQQDIP